MPFGFYCIKFVSLQCEPLESIAVHAEHSTIYIHSLCTKTLKETVDYCTSHESHVFACFIDFSKAFDYVNFLKWFYKLLEDGIHICVVNLLTHWYSHQSSCVRWGNSLSSAFSINNCVRQGGLLSPYLFTCYVRNTIRVVVNSNVGCIISGRTVNLLAYADDIVLIAPSSRALQCLLNGLHKQANKMLSYCRETALQGAL